jgi:hypothetical protein
MSHSIPLYLAFLTVPLGVACVSCDKNGADGQAVPSKAGTAESTVQSDFAKAREDFRHQKQSDLNLLDKTITDLEAKEKVAGAKAKMALDGVLPAVQAQRNAFTGISMRSTTRALRSGTRRKRASTKNGLTSRRRRTRWPARP